MRSVPGRREPNVTYFGSGRARALRSFAVFSNTTGRPRAAPLQKCNNFGFKVGGIGRGPPVFQFIEGLMDHSATAADRSHPQLAAALEQVLANYQRCGVSRFSATAAAELPSGWAAAVAARAPATASNLPPAAPRVSTRPGHTSEPSPGAVASPARASAPPRPLAPAAAGAGPLLRSLPVLDDSQRADGLERLAAEIRDCRRCSAIVGYRQQTVPGEGPLRPLVCFMGEAPGADEDRTGRPFVGQAGQLLTRIIAAMKLEREQVFILNALKCRPPQNRTPVSDEIDNCRPFVERQLEILQPQFIVCLGAVAARSLLRTEMSIGRLRGQFHDYRGAQVVITYHPSYLLRNESAKRLVWDDMKMLMAQLPAASSG